MPYSYLKENESVILNKGLIKRYRKNFYSWERKEKERQEDLERWHKKVIHIATTKQDLTRF